MAQECLKNKCEATIVSKKGKQKKLNKVSYIVYMSYVEFPSCL